MAPNVDCLPYAESQCNGNLIHQDNLAKVVKWIDEDNKPWPTEKEKGRINYKIYLATKLRARFEDIDSDFRTLVPDYVYGKYKSNQDDVLPTAVQIVNLLELAKATLEREDTEKHELLLAANYLDLAEENIVWMNSEDVLETEILDLRQRLKDTPNLDNKVVYENKLDDIQAEIADKPSKDMYKYRAILSDTYWICNTKTWEEMVNNGLQIERLRTFRNWGILCLLAVLVVAFPTAVNIDIFKNWSIHGNATAVLSYSAISANGTQTIRNLAILLITALGIAIIGGTGGYLSGLIQARSSKTNLALYEGDVLLSQLRLIFGAFAALISFALLSWNLLSGIILNNSPGPFVLVAFLSGFSERYFLNLLKIPGNEIDDEPTKVEPTKVEPTKVEPTKVEPTKVEPTKVEPTKVEPTKG